MALFIGTSFKRLIAAPETVWSNVYTLDSSNQLTAVENMDEITDHEATVMGETAEVFRTHVIAKVGPPGIITAMSKPGIQAVGDPTQLLPLWNTVKVTFSDATGRPEIKYLKLPLYIDMVDGVTIKSAVRTSVSLDYATALKDFPWYVGPNGEAHTDATVSSIIQMRQTDWHRRQRPGFKRGWVPV